jgi:hypothetical protein
MMKFIERNLTVWSALALLLLAILTGSLSGVNNVPGGPDDGFQDKAAVLLAQGNVWMILCVAATVVLFGATAALFVKGTWLWLLEKFNGSKPKDPTRTQPPTDPASGAGRRPGSRLQCFLHLLLLFFGSPGHLALALMVAVALAVWAAKRYRARFNESTGSQLGRLTNA